MDAVRRFAAAAAISAIALGLGLALGSARAEDGARLQRDGGSAAHVCLDQKERREAIQTGKVVHLGTAMRVAKARMPGAVVRARLCRRGEGLVYVLTVLARDGKVARLAVDAERGTLVGER